MNADTTREEPTMTHPINDTNDVLEDLIEAGYQATQNPDCLAGEHAWQPLHDGGLRCERCQWAPHVKIGAGR